MNIFFEDLKKNKYILGECILEVMNFLTDIMLFYFVLKILSGKYLIYNIYIVLFVKVLLKFLLFILQKRKQISHGNFKNKIRRIFIESIFDKKIIGYTVHTGELATDLWMGVEWLGVYYFEALPSFVSKCIILSCIIIYMFFVDVRIALLLIASISILWLVKKIFSSSISSTSETESKLSEDYSKMSMEALKGSETLKSLNAVNLYKNKLNDKAKLLKQASMKFVYLTSFSQGIKDAFLMVMKLVSLIVILIDFVDHGNNINLILVNIFLIFSFYKNIDALHGSFLKMSKAKGYKDKIYQYIESSKTYTEKENIEVKNSASEDIVYIRNLSFDYKQKKISALKSINLNIKAGSKVAFIGNSGSGKSTIIKCLAGFLQEFTGNVCIYGLDISDKDNLKKIKNNMSVIWQKNHIFSDTVFENIRIAKKDASEKEVIKALKDANIYDFITTLPNGIYTYIGDGGYELSGGQKSRIAIARAFLRNSSLILLDEPTSELDRENEFEIVSNLRELFEGKTVIQTAHRLETIKDFDLICYLKEGEIIYSGKHEDLLEDSKEYRNYFEIKQGEI